MKRKCPCASAKLARSVPTSMTVAYGMGWPVSPSMSAPVSAPDESAAASGLVCGTSVRRPALLTITSSRALANTRVSTEATVTLSASIDTRAPVGMSSVLNVRSTPARAAIRWTASPSGTSVSVREIRRCKTGALAASMRRPAPGWIAQNIGPRPRELSGTAVPVGACSTSWPWAPTMAAMERTTASITPRIPPTRIVDLAQSSDERRPGRTAAIHMP